MTMPRHIERERLHFCGVDVQDIVDHYVEKHWGESIRKTMAKYRTDDRNGKETEMKPETNTKHTGLDDGPELPMHVHEKVDRELARTKLGLGGIETLDERVATMHETEHLGHADLKVTAVTDLFPCQHCGDTDPQLHADEAGASQVRCSECGVRTGWYAQWEHAFNSWNRRPDGKEADEMGNEPKREMTLDEVVGKLHPSHAARRELDQLRSAAPVTIEMSDNTTEVGEAIEDYTRRRRTQRIEVAGRVLAAIIGKAFMPDDPHEHSAVMPDGEDVAHFAVDYADALLARIDETEPKDGDA